jgi:hypothetical protein
MKKIVAPKWFNLFWFLWMVAAIALILLKIYLF